MDDMKIHRLLRQTHGTREYAHAVASGSVNTDAPDLGMEILRVVEQQLQSYGLEVEVFDNGPDALIWRITGRAPEEVVVPTPEQPSTEVTSPEIASMAAILLNMDDDTIRANVSSREFIRSMRSIAASALAQREKEKDVVEPEHGVEEEEGEVGGTHGTPPDGRSARMERYRR